jgi:lysophospholipase L1-like esterase
MRAQEWNHVDRDQHAAGYYVHLIDGDPASNGHDQVALRLLGQPPEWTDFYSIDPLDYLPRNPRQFQLKPGISRVAFGKPFTTNSLGLRDRHADPIPHPGVFRIAILGSSIDMGWGVGDTETYEHHLENWLNQQAETRGLPRRFEVLNCAMAAHSPYHRLLTYQHALRAWQPDLILYAATLIDARLLEIHLLGLIGEHVPTSSQAIAKALDQLGLPAYPEPRMRPLTPLDRKYLKQALQPLLDPLADQLIAELAAATRAEGDHLAILLVPRASDHAHSPQRGRTQSRLAALAIQLQIPFIDLSTTFDATEQVEIAVAPWDDHPNARGHVLLFHRLAQALLTQPELSALLFNPESCPLSQSDLPSNPN